MRVTSSGLLAALFFLIIGTFWVLGSLQEPIFYHLVGRVYHPLANVISFFALVPLMIPYMLGIDRWRPRRLLCGAMAIFALCFAGLALCLAFSPFGLAGGGSPYVYNFVGWAFFVLAKMYGSVLVSLFWTCAASSVSVDQAKRAFPFITLWAQVASFGAATLVRYSSTIGIVPLVWLSILGMLLALFLVAALRDAPLEGAGHENAGSASRGGIFEGLGLLLSKPYLRGVLVISTASLIIIALLDYQMHYLAHLRYPSLEAFSAFKGWYGQWVNGVTFLLALGGTRWLLKVIGVGGSLVLYPALAALCVGAAWLWPTFGVVTAAVIVLKALSVGFNNPVKEIVYVPELEKVRFKVKGWIDVVGYRAAFSLGSQLVLLVGEPYSALVSVGSGISMGVLCVWGYYAAVVRRHFERVSARE